MTKIFNSVTIGIYYFIMDLTMNYKPKLKLTIWQFLALGYLIVILMGSLLLTLPCSTKDGQQTTYINALFTSVSATCVTGLVPYDTGIHWTLFGQIVIILLIQIGGLGFMSVVSMLHDLIGKNMDLYQRKILMQSAGESNLTGVRDLFRRIIVGTFAFEAVGAIILSFRFVEDFGPLKGMYFAVWHSVSAFCNAGFDLMGGPSGQMFISFSGYATDPLVMITLGMLIIIGGIGFCVWNDLIKCRGNIKKLRLHTKVVIFVNSLLLIVSTLLLFVFERNNPIFSDYSTGQKWLVAFFNATTPRTAGFSAVDLSTLSDSSYLLTTILMFIGGSPASTAGGIKITTFAIIFMGMISVFRGKRDIDISNKRIDFSLLNQALAIFVACLMLVMTATLIICTIEPDSVASYKQVMFETVSALGTVGLSLSLTPLLSSVSKIILMILMYAGRVGILTLALALLKKRSVSEIKKPLDTLLIG